MAAGGSMPELATAFIGAFTGSAVGFGTIIGSAVFNVLFVIGMCAIASKEVLVLTWWPLARDVSYYSLSLILVVVFFGASSRCQIEGWEALILLLLYFVSCAFMKFNQRVYAALVRAFPRSARPSARRPARSRTSTPSPPTSARGSLAATSTSPRSRSRSPARERPRYPDDR